MRAYGSQSGAYQVCVQYSPELGEDKRLHSSGAGKLEPLFLSRGDHSKLKTEERTAKFLPGNEFTRGEQGIIAILELKGVSVW